MTIFQTQETQEITLKDSMIAIGQSALQKLEQAAVTNFWLLNNATNPQDVLDLWGTGAVDLFQSYETTVTFILSQDPSWETPITTNSYTFNQDGTVTWNRPTEA